MLAVAGISFHAVAAAPVLSPQEREVLVEMRKQYARMGLSAMTPEQETQALEQYRQQLARVMGSAMAVQQSAAALATAGRTQAALPVARSAERSTGMAGVPVTYLRPDQLMAQVKAHQQAAAFTHFESSPSGFKAHGVSMVDVEGSIAEYGADAATGNVVYVVKVNQQQSLIKFRNVNASLPPVTFAQVIDDGGMRIFETFDGQRSSGERVVATSTGVMIVRDASLATYHIGETMQAVAVPEGFSLAGMQQGDVSGTGFVLLERNVNLDPANASMAERLREARNLLTSIVKENAYDYALYNPQTGRTVPLNLSARGKMSLRMSNCERKNSLVNVCEDSTSVESLWDRDGDRNMQHYFWSAYWFNTAQGPMAVVRENTGREIAAYQLQTGERTLVAQRTLGIGVWSVKANATGNISLDMSLAFKRHRIEDVASVFEPGFEAIR